MEGIGGGDLEEGLGGGLLEPDVALELCDHRVDGERRSRRGTGEVAGEEARRAEDLRRFGTGLGSGLAAAGTMRELRTAWRYWPLFAMLIDTAEMSLAKTDRALAQRYLQLGDRPELAERILAELDRSTELVLAVVGETELLGGKRRLRDAVALRRAPVNALSHLQLRALRELRSGTGDDRTAAQLLLTVNGVSAGLQNTG